MKIAFLGPVLPYRGGISHFNTTMIEKFKLYGHEVKAFNFIKQYPSLLFPGKDQYCEEKPKVEFNVVNTLTPHNPLTWIRTGFAIKKWRPDVLIIQFWLPFFAPSFLKVTKIVKTFSKTKIVYLIHNIEFHEKWPLAKSLTKLALRDADYYITLSNSVKASLIKLMPNIKYSRIFTVRHPIFETIAAEEASDCWNKLGLKRKHTILFFGFIKPYKGVDVLLKAMPEIIDYFKKNNCEVQLVVAGEVYGSDKMYLELINELKITNYVEFHNRYISEDEIKCYFKIADITVLPYKSATQSGVVLLSYSFSVPVIVTNVGGLDEFVDEGYNGFIIPQGEPSVLASTLIKYYQEDLKDFMVSNLKQDQNKRFSWEPLIRTIENL